MRLQTITFMKGHVFGCLRFTMRDGTESPKFGDKYQTNEAYRIRDDVELARISIIRNNLYLVGLRFSYTDG